MSVPGLAPDKTKENCRDVALIGQMEVSCGSEREDTDITESRRADSNRFPAHYE
jgi:hypothetical protein